jgi:uncharacterized protein with FMN-binding domain
MRRIAIAIMGTISGLVLLFSYHASRNEASVAVATSAPAAAGSSGSSGTSGSSRSTGTSGSAGAAPAPHSAKGNAATTYTGDSVMTRWGAVQVEITVADGKITAVQAVEYPQNNARDRQINAYALPVLAQEATQAQSAQIDAVSGATVTSDGYIQSLQSALDQAHL